MSETRPNIIKHIAIRIFILIFILVASYCVTLIHSLSMEEAAIAFFSSIFFQALWFIFIFVEAISLHKSKEYSLRNTNFIILVLFGILYNSIINSIH